MPAATLASVLRQLNRVDASPNRSTNPNGVRQDLAYDDRLTGYGLRRLHLRRAGAVASQSAARFEGPAGLAAEVAVGRRGEAGAHRRPTAPQTSTRLARPGVEGMGCRRVDTPRRRIYRPEMVLQRRLALPKNSRLPQKSVISRRLAASRPWGTEHLPQNSDGLGTFGAKPRRFFVFGRTSPAETLRIALLAGSISSQRVKAARPVSRPHSSGA